MKTKWFVLPLLASLCIFASCSKKDTPGIDTPPPNPTPIDSSKCLLTNVNYESPSYIPYVRDPITYTYDNQNRIMRADYYYTVTLFSYEANKIIQRTYHKSVSDTNLISRYIYNFDNNGRVVYHTTDIYIRPTSENSNFSRDSTSYEYNGDGYVTKQIAYTGGSSYYKVSNFTYQNGNLAQRENIYMIGGTNPVKQGGDTLTYTYDNTPWFAEANYLYEVTDFRFGLQIGKPNKNNVTGIQCKMYDITGSQNLYRSIQYTYSVKDSKLQKVTMVATTTKNYTVNTTFGFAYKCN